MSDNTRRSLRERSLHRNAKTWNNEFLQYLSAESASTKKKKKGAACFHRWSWLVPIEADIQGETLTDTQRLTPRRM